MEKQEIVTADSAGMLENVLVNGDLSKLSPAQRLDYYRQVCRSMGLNPLSKPFDYIILNGKMTLYARKDAADQLRKINGVSIDKIETNTDGDFICITAYGHDKTGRCDVELGVVSKRDMRGDFANAMMKAMTKAKRRLTLSLCGLGWLDETEVETIPDARPVVVDSGTGEIMQGGAQMEDSCQPKTARPAFDEVEFLTNWTRPAGVSQMSLANAEKRLDSKGQPYGEKSTYELFNMLRVIMKKIGTLPEEQKQEYQMKLSAVCTILHDRKVGLTIAGEERPDPFVNRGEA